MFTYSPLRRAFEKHKNDWRAWNKTKTCYCKSKKSLSALASKEDHKYDDKDIYKETFEKIVPEKFDEIKELTHETNQNDLTYYFKVNTFRKWFDDYDDGVELF